MNTEENIPSYALPPYENRGPSKGPRFSLGCLFFFNWWAFEGEDRKAECDDDENTTGDWSSLYGNAVNDESADA